MLCLSEFSTSFPFHYVEYMSSPLVKEDPNYGGDDGFFHHHFSHFYTIFHHFTTTHRAQDWLFPGGAVSEREQQRPLGVAPELPQSPGPGGGAVAVPKKSRRSGGWHPRNGGFL